MSILKYLKTITNNNIRDFMKENYKGYFNFRIDF